MLSNASVDLRPWVLSACGRHFSWLFAVLLHCASQIRISWLVALRILLSMAYAANYQHPSIDLPHPWLQAVAVNSCSFCVSLMLDRRLRRMYTQHMERLASSGSSSKKQQTELSAVPHIKKVCMQRHCGRHLNAATPCMI